MPRRRPVRFFLWNTKRSRGHCAGDRFYFDPSRPTDTLPKSDDLQFGCSFIVFIVGFGRAGRGRFVSPLRDQAKFQCRRIFLIQSRRSRLCRLFGRINAMFNASAERYTRNKHLRSSIVGWFKALTLSNGNWHSGVGMDLRLCRTNPNIIIVITIDYIPNLDEINIAG